MKILLALMFTLSAFSVFAIQSESNCAQIEDSADRTARVVADDDEPTLDATATTLD